MKTAERLLALVQEIEVRPGQSAEELAERFGCSTHTIEQDVQERLPELGVVAVNEDGYKFLQRPFLRSLALTHQELVSVILAHKVACPNLDEDTGRTLDRVVDKLRSALSSNSEQIGERQDIHQYDLMDGDPVTLKLMLKPSLARWFEENKPHPSVKVEGHDATVTVSNPEAFLRWFASLDGAQVLGPEKYRNWFVDRLLKLARLY